MKKLLVVLALLPTMLLAQCPWVNYSFPEVTHFDGNLTPLTFNVPWANDWIVQSGPTPSSNTGPTSDFSGIGSYIYTEASNTFNTLFVFQTECFNVDALPGMELSFWYHMYGASMGDLEVFIIETSGDTTEIYGIYGDQGDLWKQAVFDLDSLGVSGDFLMEFHGTTGASFTSDMAVDNIRIGFPIVLTYGCTDTAATNFDPLAIVNDSSCIYPPCSGIQNLQGQITCFQYAPNQGQVNVSWDPTSSISCQPSTFYYGTDINNLQSTPWNIWNGNNFNNYTTSTPLSDSLYYFIIETYDGSQDTLILQNPNCGVGCTDIAASNYNPFAGVDDSLSLIHI